MIGLLIFLLLVLAAIYGVFFLFFKVIWLLLKKSQNKWPLILAGISTALSVFFVMWMTWWGVNKIMTPFRPAYARIKANPQPIYGLRTYTDSKYGFTLQVKDGMDFSEWIDFDGASLKAGINTNIFKKDAAGKQISGPVLFSMLIRQTSNINEKDPFASLEKELSTSSSGQDRFEIKQMTKETIDGYPAYYIEGIAYSNRGPIPAWVEAIYDNHAILYVAIASFNKEDISGEEARAFVSSLRPKAALPAPEAGTEN